MGIEKKTIKSFIFVLLLLGLFLTAPFLVSQTLALSPIAGLTNAAQGTGLQNNADIPKLAAAIVNAVLGLLGVILVLMIIYAGIMWMISQGDKSKVEKAKNIIYSAIIGLIIVFAAYGISAFVVNSLSNASG